MNKARLTEILEKRRERHVCWIFIGCTLSPEEARELGRLGYGEVRGGDNGVFWLYPFGGKEKQTEIPNRAAEVKKPRGRKQNTVIPIIDARQQALKEW